MRRPLDFCCTRSRDCSSDALSRTRGAPVSPDLLEIEPITLGRIVDKLQTLGLIERRPDPSDRRVWLLHLTPAAHPKLSQLRRLGDVTRGEALAGVPEADTERLLKTLQALKANLTNVCDPPVAGQKRVSHG